MGFDKTMAVKDHLLFNIDPSIIESYANSKDSVSDNIASGIKFYGYIDNDDEDTEGTGQDLTKAFTKSSFKFDGKNDYIIFDYDDSKGFENGMVFEFYGKILGERKAYG